MRFSREKSLVFFIIENGRKKDIELKDLIERKHKIESKICKLEFEKKSYKKILDDLGIKFHLIKRTPLGKNHENWQKTIGISKEDYQFCKENSILIVIGIMNKMKVNEHIFYVFDIEKDLHFKSGYTSSTEYINFGITIEDKHYYLKTIEEYLEEIENVD